MERKIGFAVLGMETFNEKLVEVVQFKATCIEPENPIGNLASGQLVLRGRPLKISLPTTISWH